MITVYYELYTKHTNVLCGKNVEILNVETKDTQSNLGCLRVSYKCHIVFLGSELCEAAVY
jgi:hypothetical protein